MRNLLIAILCVSAFGCSNDERKPANVTEENIYRSADSMMTAFKKRDWKTFARFNNPAMMKIMGGQEAFEQVISQQMQQIPDTSIKKMEAGKILKVVKTNVDQQCVLEQLLEMNSNGYKVISTTYLIGESLNNGKSWTFFDASNEGVIKPIDIKPNLSPELKIPQKKQELKQL